MKIKRSFKVWIVGVAVVAAAAFAWWWKVTGEERAIVLANAPALPDLSAVPTMMRDRITDANTRAITRTETKGGLAELAQLYQANGFLDEAAACYAGLERLEPSEPRWAHLHATILAGYGEADSAVKLWLRVAELAPDYLPARIRMGDCLLKANRATEAEAAYEAALKIEPGQPHAMFGLARIDFEAARWEKARQRLEAVVSSTNYQLGYDLIVTLYERLGLDERARAIRGMASASGAYRDPADPWLDALVEYCFDPFRLSLHAGVIGRVGDRATAQRLLERAIELAPNDVAVRFQLGTLAVEQGNVKLATEQLERCTILAPDFSDGWAHLSSLQAQQGNALAAERTLAAGLKHCPQSPGLHLMRARNLRKAGRVEEAINEYMISTRLRPNEPEAFLELGNTLIAVQREAEGIAQIRFALNAEPANPTALAILTFHAITQTSENEAREWMTKVANQPRVPSATINALKQAYRQRFGRDFM